MRILLRGLGVWALLLLCIAAWSKSKLDDFEHDVNGPDKPTTSDSQHDDHNDDHHHDKDKDDGDDALSSCLSGCCSAVGSEAGQSCLRATGELCGHAIAPLWEMSYLRVANPGPGAIPYTARRTGEPLLPLLRFDAAYRPIDQDMSAVDVRAEGGYGPLALHLSESHYSEIHPVDSLDVVEGLLCLRFSLQADAEVDAGAGFLTLVGNEEQGHFALGLPVLIHPHRAPWGLEFRPLVSDRLTDLDLAAFAHARYFSLKAGYRTMLGPHTSLSGPYVGMTAEY